MMKIKMIKKPTNLDDDDNNSNNNNNDNRSLYLQTFLARLEVFNARAGCRRQWF